MAGSIQGLLSITEDTKYFLDILKECQHNDVLDDLVNGISELIKEPISFSPGLVQETLYLRKDYYSIKLN